MSSVKPLISVIIPAFNYARYLPFSIQSVKDQTYENWECIVVDDGSTDDTESVMTAIVANDDRIKYVKQKNAGPTVARNCGVKLAKGNYIQFLDADDLLEKEKFEKQLAVFNADKELDIVYGPTKYFEDARPHEIFYDLELTSKTTWMPNISGAGDKIIKNLLRSNIMVISAPLVSKRLFDNYGAMDETLYFNEDWELWLKFAVNGAVFRYVEEDGISVLVRVHSSYSKDNFKMFVNGLMVCKKYLKQLGGYQYRKILRPKINYHTKVIDSKIMDALKTNRPKAVEMNKYVLEATGMFRYKIYNLFLSWLPLGLCRLGAFKFSVISKLSSLIIYGA